MKYIKGVFENYKYFIEVNNNGIPFRQLAIDNGIIQISCKEDCLAEGTIYIEDLDGIVTYIDKEEFENIWNEEIEKHLNNWEIQKQENHVGKNIIGYIKYFYPQGAIIEINNSKTKAIYHLKNDNFFSKLCIGDKLSGVVICYDEINMWLILDNIKLN